MTASQGSVRLEGVVKRHGDTVVLRGVDLAIELVATSLPAWQATRMDGGRPALRVRPPVS